MHARSSVILSQYSAPTPAMHEENKDYISSPHTHAVAFFYKRDALPQPVILYDTHVYDAMTRRNPYIPRSTKCLGCCDVDSSPRPPHQISINLNNDVHPRLESTQR
ncbi:hypothetical protein F2P81_016632 [Scophthalmus maximus]|uniref:Uncharacterized protein n=1 Tax=Scophthalmus maximus TaxID=52904 RepID=A0A6A4SFP6_SCOMX|nr:hypothetical protein F2P81_016632 [Scophthalmus maximus]